MLISLHHELVVVYPITSIPYQNFKVFWILKLQKNLLETTYMCEIGTDHNLLYFMITKFSQKI